MSDYISREAAFDSVFQQFCASSDETESALNAAIDKIKAIPAADVRPVKRGKWTNAIVAASKLYDHLGMTASMRGYVCSCCQDFSVARYNFCPNCGAWMEES